MILNVTIDLQLDYDKETDQIRVLSCNPVVQNSTLVSPVIQHELTETQVKFGILTLGKKMSAYLPQGTEIEIYIDGENAIGENKFLKTHSQVKGRIDGLTKMFKKYSEKLQPGIELDISYDSAKKRLSIQTPYAQDADS